jgi:hypothetical protein
MAADETGGDEQRENENRAREFHGNALLWVCEGAALATATFRNECRMVVMRD